MLSTNKNQTEKLDEWLTFVQKKEGHEEFIYGITNRLQRSFFQKLQDFFIDRSEVPVKEKAYFFELLATMLHAGIPLNRALKILIAKTANARLRRIIATISYELEHGKPLSAALELFPEVFEETERGAIKSAEAVGHLENMLFKIAGNLNRRSELMMRLKAALIYPVAVMIALAIAGAVMLIFVVPRIRELFEQSSLSLPWPTRFLLEISLFLNNSWWLLFIIAILAVIVFHTYTNSEDGRFVWDFKKLRIPLLGNILRKIFVIRFTDTLGMLIESGLPINKSLEYVAASVGNEIYRLKTFEALAAVQHGGKLSATLAVSPFLFPATVTNMIAVGEHSASLGDVCQKIGGHFEKEIDYTLKNMTTVLGPLLILFIGASVAFFALAVLSPIFSLSQAVA